MTAAVLGLDEVQALIDQMITQLEGEIAVVIAEALRSFADRPVSEKGGISIQFGTVAAAYDGYADILLDGQAAPTPCTVLSGAAIDSRVAVLFYPPSGALMLGPFTGTVTSPGGGFGAGARIVAAFEQQGTVIPVAATDPTTIVATGTITDVVCTLATPPSLGQECMVDVFLNGVSLWAVPTDRAKLVAGETSVRFTLSAPIVVTAFVDIITAAIVNPAGKTLWIGVVGL